MVKYYNVEPLVNLLADKDPLESVNVGAVLQALQHGLYNGEVAPVVRAKWLHNSRANAPRCLACGRTMDNATPYCPFCGARMDEKGS